MKAMQIYVTDQQHKFLRKIYAETGQRMTETIRQAIDEYIKNEKKQICK